MSHVRPEPIAPENSGSPSSLGGKPAPMPELKHVDPPQSSVDDNMSIGTADKPRAMPDVQFDDGASDNLRNALNSAADTIETQQGGRDGLLILHEINLRANTPTTFICATYNLPITPPTLWRCSVMARSW